MLNQNNQGFMHSQRGLILTLTPGIVEEASSDRDQTVAGVGWAETPRNNNKV